MKYKLDSCYKNVFKRKKCLIFSVLVSMIVILFMKYTIESRVYLKSRSTADCLFCKIANGSITPPILEFENDEFVIFKDKKPASKYHYLAIPKQHYESIKVLNKSHVDLVDRMHKGMIDFLASKGVNADDAIIGYHIPPFISQHHLHLHGISPVSEMGISDRISFMMPSFWFKSAEDTLRSLQKSDL